MDFEDLLNDDVEKTIAAASSPLLVAFRTNGNQRCNELEKWLSEQNYKENLRLGRMDVDTNRETRRRFGILSLPNLVLFKGSVDLRIGWIGPWLEKNLREFLKPYL